MTTIKDALIDLNDAMKGHSQYGVGTMRDGTRNLIRIDTVRPIRVMFLGRDEETAAEAIMTIVAWESETGGRG